MKSKKICVVTGTRAEYGLLKPLMERLHQDDGFLLQIIATNMHLSPEFGLTYKQIEEDGFVIDQKVEMLLSSDTAVAVAKSLGLGTICLAEAFDRLLPDLVVLLGDRFEALAAAQAAMLARIPIVHIHGGEVTEGAVDESIRHAITKMANLHFVATDEFRRRVIQMGEQPARVITTGAPGIDNIVNADLLSKNALSSDLGIDLVSGFFLVTYHPVTLGHSCGAEAIENLLAAIDTFPDRKIIITFPNADTDGRQLIQKIKDYVAARPERTFLTNSLGQFRYLSALKHADAVIGNSSSGLIEAPSFRTPTVNIGERQKGRLRAESVINCDESKQSIIDAIHHALSDEFKRDLTKMTNPYGDGQATNRMLEQLRDVDPKELVRKPFHDVSHAD